MHDLVGFWSRCINLEHMMVYSIDKENQIVTIHSMLGHY
ncbi:MAG: hypothetical protein ACOYMD_12680 [Paludibacter sp.]